MKAYLEKCDKEWFDDFVYTARQPLQDRGLEIVPFNGAYLSDFINSTHFNPNDIVVGSVEATKAFWEAVGITPPKYLGYPNFGEEFNPYKRKITTATFKEVGDMKFPLFIKPKNDVKLFTGMVLENKKSYDNSKLFYPEITDELEIYVSEVLDIVSEYRCFVHKGKLVGIKHYDGDFTKFIDTEFVEDVISNFEDSPVSYTVDVGYYEERFENGELATYGTCLIEINDFWAIGGYGLDGKTYVRMLIDRFQEIKKENNL